MNEPNVWEIIVRALASALVLFLALGLGYVIITGLMGRDE